MKGAADPNLAREQRFSSALQQLIGYRLVEWGPDRAVIAYEVAKDHLNRTNRLHGGIIATVCDTAGGYCGGYCDTPGETRSTVTLSLTVNFVASVSGGRVTRKDASAAAARPSSSRTSKCATTKAGSSPPRSGRSATSRRPRSA
jgi:uncharacterized protein (TIGR00369 family)